eukprot:5204275-Amphidinium_carterae.1
MQELAMVRTRRKATVRFGYNELLGRFVRFVCIIKTFTDSLKRLVHHLPAYIAECATSENSHGDS